MPPLQPTIHFAHHLDAHPVEWLWPLRIPYGALTLLVGDPGLGKSLLALDIAARISAPHPWPDTPSIPKSLNPSIPDPNPSCLRASVPSCLPHLGSALLLAPEDHSTTAIIPRLRAARADLSRVALITGQHESRPRLTSLSPSTRALEAQSSDSPLNPPIPQSLNPSPSCLRASVPLCLPQHANLLAMAVRSVHVPRLLIIDPLHAALAPAAGAGGDALIQSLTALTDIARTYGIAVLAVVHLTKTRSHRLLYRVRGSLTLSAFARSILMLSRDPDVQGRRILTTIKTIYGPPPPPLSFQIVPAGLDPSALNSSIPKSPNPPNESAPSAQSADSVWSLSPQSAASPSCLRALVPPCLSWTLGPSAPCALYPDLPDDAHSALADACDWLADYLSRGPRPAAELITTARAAGHSLITLRRAKRALAVKSRKSRRKRRWLWALTPQKREGDHLGVTQS